MNAPRMIQYRLLTLVPGVIALAVFISIAILPPVSHAQTSNGAGGEDLQAGGNRNGVTVDEIFDVDVRNTSFGRTLNLNFSRAATDKVPAKVLEARRQAAVRDGTRHRDKSAVVVRLTQKVFPTHVRPEPGYLAHRKYRHQQCR